MTLWRNLVVALVAAFALAACSSSSDKAEAPTPAPEPSAYETALDAIAAATTAEAAQAAYDAVKADATAAEGAELQAAVNTRVAALAAATDVSDADKAMYQGRVTVAKAAVATAQSSLDHTAQTMALSDAVEALQAIDLTDLSTQAKIDAAEAAIAAVRATLDGATALSATEKTAATTELATAHRTVMMAQGRFDTDAQKLDATVDVTVAKRRAASAKETLTANVDGQKMALMTAGTTANGTTWSIDGNAAPESGIWSGQMYDELPGLTIATPPGDRSNVPTTVTGTFYSEFSTIGRMVGAFGADKQ
jgi:hypothetical protein